MGWRSHVEDVHSALTAFIADDESTLGRGTDSDVNVLGKDDGRMESRRSGRGEQGSEKSAHRATPGLVGRDRPARWPAVAGAAC